MQKTILKQQYENFTASRFEGLDKTYDWFQKLISQLEIHGKVISQEDANLKHNEHGDTLHQLKCDMKLMIEKPDQTQGSQSNSQQWTSEDLSSGLNIDELKDIGFSNGRRCHFARECRAPRNQGNRNGDAPRRIAEEGPTDFALMAHLSLGSSSSLSSDSENLNEIEEENNQVNDRFKKVEGYHAVPPPYTGNYMPSRTDLSFAGLDDYVYKTNMSETITSVPRNKSTVSKFSKDRSPKGGKFEWKANEGFLVGYSVNSKAFRVFNTRTKKVEENLHIKFLENKPNVAGSGPEWLFDIDSLTKSMNYKPLTIGNQTNDDAGPKSSDDEFVDDDGKKNDVQYPAKYSDKNGHVKDVRDQEEALRKQFDQETERLVGQGEATITNSTNRLNTISPSVNNDLPTDPLMPDLEDSTGIFRGVYDDEDVGAEADLNNLETTMNVSPIPITRIHKDHPKDQIIRDINSAIP
ncbi:hypothetical protein Tco_0178416 [Tanacetum coccineum]